MQFIKVFFEFGAFSAGLMRAVVGLLAAGCLVPMQPAQASSAFREPGTAIQMASFAGNRAIAPSLDDYQPPDVGGPGQTKGAGTR
jgi:hypothetical protein